MTTLDRTFTLTLQRSLDKGGRIFGVLPPSTGYFGTRGLVRIGGRVDCLPLQGSVMALGDGTHNVAVSTDLRSRIDNQADDIVTPHLDERIPLTPRRSLR